MSWGRFKDKTTQDILEKKLLLSWIKGWSYQHVFDVKLQILFFMLHISHYIYAKLCAVLKIQSV